MNKMLAAMTPEQRKEYMRGLARKGNAAMRAATTPEQRAAWASVGFYTTLAVKGPEGMQALIGPSYQAKYGRVWTPTRSESTLVRATARGSARRAHKTAQTCACGAKGQERHHPDIFGHPQEIVWMCRACHVATSRAQARQLAARHHPILAS